MRCGYSAWTNPFNGVKSYVAYNDTRFIVFWSKNPKPLLQHLDYLNEKLNSAKKLLQDANDIIADLNNQIDDKKKECKSLSEEVMINNCIEKIKQRSNKDNDSNE